MRKNSIKFRTWKDYDAVLEDIIKKDGLLDTMLAQTRKSWEDDKVVNIKMDYEGTADSEAELVRKFIRDKRKWVSENIDKRLGDSKAKLTYKKLSGSKKIIVNKKTGNLTIKKGLKKGTYKVKIRLTSGDKNYTKKTKKVTVKVVLK